MESKKKLLEKLIRLHQAEIVVSKEMIARLGSSSSFEDAVAKEKARIPRLEDAIQKLEKNRDAFDQPKTKIEVGSLVTIESSQFGKRFNLIVDETEISILDPKTYKVFAVKKADFKFEKIGDERTYETGRPGEQFEVKEKVVAVQ